MKTSADKLAVKWEKRLNMIEWVLMYARDLALTVWLGGLIIIDFVETPARFRVTALNRNQIVAVGREVFAAFNRAEVIVGAVLVASSAALASRGTTARQETLWATACVGLMWLVAISQYVWARPRMSAATKDLDLVNRRPEDPRLRMFRRWHKTYVALDFVKMALGLAALGLWL